MTNAQYKKMAQAGLEKAYGFKPLLKEIHLLETGGNRVMFETRTDKNRFEYVVFAGKEAEFLGKYAR